MTLIRDAFGSLRDGRAVTRFTLANSIGFSIALLDFGGILQTINVRDRQGAQRNVVLKYDSADLYEQDAAYLGAAIGRCANRIDQAKASIDGLPVLLTPNASPHHLHGGVAAFNKVIWKVLRLQDGPRPKIVLGHRSPHLSEGYPGTAEVTLTYCLSGPQALSVLFRARTDRTTLMNLTVHPYFNLTGDPSKVIDEHELRINAPAMLPVRGDLIPTGDLRPVNGTPFDFTQRRRIGDPARTPNEQLMLANGYDHSFVLRRRRAVCAELACPQSGMRMLMRTNQPALQVYTGNTLAAATLGAFASRAGICLEPQGFPNSINESRFPSVLLRPGETYRHLTTFSFAAQ